MDTHINVLQMQLDKVKQSNKHMKGARGEKGKIQGSVILTTEIIRMELILKSALDEIAKHGVNVEKCREGIVLK